MLHSVIFNFAWLGSIATSNGAREVREADDGLAWREVREAVPQALVHAAHRAL